MIGWRIGGVKQRDGAIRSRSLYLGGSSYELGGGVMERKKAEEPRVRKSQI